MSVKKPYHRNYRGFITDDGYSSWAFIMDRRYAQSPEHYLRAFFLIQDDLKKLFEYVEPSEETKYTYSHRIHALLMRTCIEIEANFKAILLENTYTGTDFNMNVYKKVNVTHHLSSYQVILPIWNGTEKKLEPFKNWSQGGSLSWYQAYNQSKHNRQDLFKKANLENLLDAVSALLILLTSQFYKEDFSPGPRIPIVFGDEYHPMKHALGDYFRIHFPTDWKEDEIYEFDWHVLKKEKEPFEKIDYNGIHIK